MTDPWCCYINGAPWIPSIYPSHVSIYASTMDPMGMVRPRLQVRHGPQQAPRRAARGVARGLPGLARARHGGGGDALRGWG